MSKFIVLLPRLEVSGANAQPVWWFMAPPSPTAYVGFGQALALRCLPAGEGESFIGVGVVVHDYRLRAERIAGEYSMRPHQLRAAALINSDDYASGSVSLSSQPTARCDMIVSIAVVFEEGSAVDMDKVDTFMCSARLAGGTVSSESNKPEILEDMTAVKERLKSGCYLCGRPDLMNAQEGEDALDTLLRATRPTVENWKANPFVMPATMGFAAVTKPQARVWTRDGHIHAFAEPLVGLVQLKRLSEAGSTIPVWKYQPPSDRVFLVGH